MIELLFVALTIALVAGARRLTRPRWPIGWWLIVNGEAHWITNYNDRTATLTVTPAFGAAFHSDAAASMEPPQFAKRV
jgi:hypothetical protein